MINFTYIYKFTYTCKCMDINLDRNLSAYLRLRILFFNCVSVIKKNPSFYYAKSVPKNHILTDFVFLKFWCNPEQINHNSCERAISLNKNYKYIHFPLTCHFLMRPVNRPFLASISSPFFAFTLPLCTV